jgi:hypothetical protein
MRIEAVIGRDDLVELLRGFIPVEIALGQAGSDDLLLTVDSFSGIELAPEVGIRVKCAAHLRWSVLGLDVPVHADTLELLVQPRIDQREGKATLVLGLAVERAEIRGMPALVDGAITERLNREIAQRRVELAWDFASTLTSTFALPTALRTAEALALQVADGCVKVTEQALGMAVSFHVAVHPRDASVRNGR